jgi:hypothetical protein
MITVLYFLLGLGDFLRALLQNGDVRAALSKNLQNGRGRPMMCDKMPTGIQLVGRWVLTADKGSNF